jgi:hypothetical protein
MTSRVFHGPASPALSTTLVFFTMFFFAMFTLLFTIALPAYGAQRCSNASLQGNYGYLVSGTAGGNPVTIMGQMSADGNGAITGYQSASRNGVIEDVLTLAGSYKISSKCSGSATLAPQGGTTATYNLTVLTSGKVQLVAADSGTVQSGFALPQGVDSCSTGKTKGVFSLTENGTIVGQGAASFGGQLTLRGNGTLVGTRWGSLNGTISSGDAISGIFKIVKICQGGAVVGVNQQSPIHLNLVVVDGEHEVLFMQTDAGTVLSGTLEQ